jgi:poly(A) polymerase
MRAGGAHRSVWLAWETGVLDVLVPELSGFLSDASQDNRSVWRLLGAIDRVTKQRREPLDDAVLWTLLLLEPLREACDGARDRVAAAYDFLEPIVERLAVPRRIADAMRRIVAALPRLESGRAGRFTKTQLYPTAAEVLAVLQVARSDGGTDAAADDEDPETATSAADAARGPRRRRRRRKRREGTETAPPAGE